MPEEIESRATCTTQPHSAANPSWLTRKDRFLRALFMISVYVFGALCLISVLILGTFALISGILLGLVLAAILGIVVLQIRRRRG